MNRVTIRTKKKCKGTMLYVNPANEIQREHNAMIDEIAEAIRCDRYMRMVNKDYSFIVSHQPTPCLLADFL